MYRRGFLISTGALALAACSKPDNTPEAVPLIDLSDLEARYGGRIGLAYDDGQKAVAWRGDERFNYCSTFKLFLVAAILMAAEKGLIPLDRQVNVTGTDLVSHAPVTSTFVGKAMTVEALCKASIKVSDNTAANLLIRELGGLEAFELWYRSIGDRITRVDRWETELNRPDGDKDTTTANQAAANLKWLRAPLLKEMGASFPLIWEWGVHATAPDRIRGGLSDQGFAVASKTGSGAQGQTNEIAWLVPKGPLVNAHAIAVYYAPEQEVPAAERDAVVAEATRRAIAALGHGQA